MDHGKNVVAGTAAELKASLKNRETIHISLRKALTEEELQGLREINHVYDVRETKGELVIRCDGGEHNLVHIMNYLEEKQIHFGRVTTELPTLNDVFLEVTGKELRD